MKPIHNRIAQKFFLSCILFVFAAIAPLCAQDGWTYTCDNTLPTLSQVMVDACGSGEWRNEFIILKTRDSSFDIRKLRLRSFNPATNGTAGSITNALKIPSTETNNAIASLNELVNTCSNYGTAFVEVAASPFNGIVPPYSTILLFNNIPDLNGLNINTFAPLCGSRIFVAFGNYTNQTGSLFINNQPGGNCPSGCFRRLNISFTGNLADTCTKYTYDMSRLPRPIGGNPYTGYGEGSYYRPLPDGTLGYGGGMMNNNLCMTDSAMQCVIPSISSSFLTNKWRVNAYSGAPNVSVPRGYYEVENADVSAPLSTLNVASVIGANFNFAFEFNANRHFPANRPPSDAFGGGTSGITRPYEGCLVDNNNFNLTALRTGFLCGYYKIYLSNGSDRVRIKIENSNNDITYDQIENNLTAGVIWEGVLNEDSRITMTLYKNTDDNDNFSAHIGFYKRDIFLNISPNLKLLCDNEQGMFTAILTPNINNAVINWLSSETGLQSNSGTSVNYIRPPSVTSATLSATYAFCPSIINTAQINAPTSLMPSYGNNFWNVLGFNGSNNFINEAYRGYYVQRGDHDWNNGNFEFNPARDGWADISSPSSANVAGGAARNWEGCSVNNDNFSIYAKRKGFPCGRYYVKIQSLEDGGRIKIDQNGDGIAEFEQTFGLTYSTDIWNGILGDSSKMEIWAYDHTANFSAHIEFSYMSIAKDTTRKDSIVCNLGQVGTFTRLLKNRYGCDSVVITNVQFGGIDTTNLPILSRCNPNDTATITRRLQNVFGCDSIVIQRFTLNEKDTIRFDSLSCNPLSIGVSTRVFVNRYGCDSVVLVNVILARKDTTILLTQSRCNPNDTATITRRLQNIFGCDSIVIQRFTLARKDTIILPTQSRCNPNDTATITRRLQNVFGCDSIVIQRFTLARKDTIIFPTQSRCNPNDTATITRRLQNIFGCDSIVIQRFTLVPADISFSLRVLRAPNCAYETGDIEMTQPIGASPPFSLVWQQGTRDSLVLHNRQVGLYRVTVTDAQGCQRSDSIWVVTKFLLDRVFEVTSPVCYGNKGTLIIQTISGGMPPIYWQLNNQNVQRWQNNILVFNDLQVGRHILKLSDANGCQRADTFFIPEPPRLNIIFEASQIRIKEKDTIRLLPRLNFVPQSLNWSPPTDLNCNNCLTPLATPTQSRTYRLTARDTAGCEVSSNISVIVEKTRRVYPPSNFTPNGDGHNDFFTIFSDADVEKIKILQIYNRWGIKVFEKENFQTNIETEGWDGTLNGVSLPPDVYVYYFIVAFKDGEEIIYQGDITILK